MLTLLIIGDSITLGMQPYLVEAFRAQPSVGRVWVEAETGASTAAWQRGGRIAALVASRRPDVVVLVLGTNDEGSEDQEEGYEALVGRAASDARSHGARVLWIGPFQEDAGGRARTAIIRRTVGSGGVIDGVELASGLSRAPDGLHLQMGEYRALAVRLAARVVERAGAGGGSAGSSAAPALGAILIGAVAGLLVAWAAGR